LVLTLFICLGISSLILSGILSKWVYCWIYSWKTRFFYIYWNAINYLDGSSENRIDNYFKW